MRGGAAHRDGKRKSDPSPNAVEERPHSGRASSWRRWVSLALLLLAAPVAGAALVLGWFEGQRRLATAAAAEEGALCHAYAGLPAGQEARRGMLWIPAGAVRLGSERHYREERGGGEVAVAGFWIDRHEVTNAQFAAFAEATGHVTVAERAPRPEDVPGARPEELVPGSVVFRPPTSVRDLRDIGQWWAWTPGASWRRPEGPTSGIADRMNHPVVHVAYEDALAYARWAGRDLPTEAEWERAARGGLVGRDYAWGDELAPEGRHRANTWQGLFPVQNTAADGFAGTAPVGCFEPNGHGLFDMAGNVWEWTGTPFTPLGHGQAPPQEPDAPRALKGGSWLCAPTFCARYRPAARQPGDLSTGTSHTGFRTVARP